MKRSAIVKFKGNQEHYRIGCENTGYAYCRDCKKCAGSKEFRFISDALYNAYFLEFWQGKRDSLHIKGADGKIEDFVPLEDFTIISDEDNVLNTHEAIIRCITHEYDDELFDITFGKEYKAIGFDENNLLLVMDDSWDCYFYSRQYFEIISDPHNILDEKSNDPIYAWDETHIDSIPHKEDAVTMKKLLESHSCPVCGQFQFERRLSHEICEVCGWQDDIFDEDDKDAITGANSVELEEARKQYAAFKKVEW